MTAFPNGIRIEEGRRVDTIKGVWGMYECTYQLPGTMDWHDGYIQGDGHIWAEETLEDEDGNPIKP